MGFVLRARGASGFASQRHYVTGVGNIPSYQVVGRCGRSCRKAKGLGIKAAAEATAARDILSGVEVDAKALKGTIKLLR